MKMNRTKATALLVLIVFAFIFTAGFTGCSGFESGIHDLHGDIVGNEYIIDGFDNNGKKSITVHGQKIGIDHEIYKELVVNSDGSVSYVHSLSSVITITIDGKEMKACGDTVVFRDARLKPDYDFELDPENTIESTSTNGVWDNTMIAGRVNKIKNYIGKPMVVVVKSQTGAPIYCFSGNSVYSEIVDNMPKFTKFYIDDMALYVHRSNYYAFDLSLLD